MQYKGFRATVHPPTATDGTPSKATFTIRDDTGALVHEGVVHGRFEDGIDAEDAGYDAARQWIDAKCRVN